MKKYRWGIIADIIRELSNPSNSNLSLGDTDTELALQDLANIIDTMCVQKCGFNKAVQLEREENEEFAEWIAEVLEVIE